MSRSPFLIVGAMKSGTTSLFKDLSMHPEIFVPHDEKEPEALTADDVLLEEGKERYLSLFSEAGSGQIFGEASTAYTKQPEFSGAPSRAKEIFGDNLKILYIVRNPIDRIVSHHHHDVSEGKVDLELNEAVRSYSPLINYSRYFYQISQWVSEFGSCNVFVVKFEDYKLNRKGVVRDIVNFLEVDVGLVDSMGFEEVYNKSEGKPVVKGGWKKASRHPFYRKFIRPLLSWRFRRWIRHSLVPKSKAKKEVLNDSSLNYIANELADDSRMLGEMMGLERSPWELKTPRKG